MATTPDAFGCTLAVALALVAATLVATAPPASGAGARPVTDTHAGDADHGHAEDLTRVGRRLFFEIEDTIHGAELWRTNGTPRATRLVRDIRRGDKSSDPDDLTNVNGALFFTAKVTGDAETLWRSDGTRAGTRLVRGISGQLRQLTAAGGTLFFVFDDGTGRELWHSDGTRAGTSLVRDIRPGTKGSAPSELTDVAGTLFFGANDGTHGPALWRSDGTEAGTSLVRDIDPDDGSFLSELTNVAGALFFNAWDGADFGLWRSDGTPEGTTPVRPGYVFDITDVEGTLFFRGYDSVHGSELWRSDGSEAGTSLVRDINLGTRDSHPFELTNVGGLLLFTAHDGIHGEELWRSDGTESGTRLIRDIKRRGSGTERFQENQLTEAGGTLFFEADDGTHGQELWRSNGTRRGTRLVRDLDPGRASSSPDWITSGGNSVFFYPFLDGTQYGHAELWRAVP